MAFFPLPFMRAQARKDSPGNGDQTHFGYLYTCLLVEGQLL